MTGQTSVAEGQRILANIHIMCSTFRETVRSSMLRLKEQEYIAAKSETVQAQHVIEAKRLVELQQIADNQTRPLTALEKVRLLHLQSMQDKQAAAAEQKQPEILDKTFAQLLDQTSSIAHFSGLKVEEELEKLIIPFLQGLVGKVEELYTVNQQLLIMAAKCRAETLKEKKNSQVFRTKIQELQDQISHDEDNLTRLRQGMEDRSVQLEALRTAYHREVIQVKEQVVEQVSKQGVGLNDINNIMSRGFDSTLLQAPVGKDDEGRSLDDLLKAMISEYDSSGRWGLRRSKKKGEGQDAAEEPSSNPEGDNMSNGNARIMILENELVQTQLRNVVLRYGMEMWRGKTERYRALGADNL